MVNDFKYQAETFDISVDGNVYPVSTSKLFLIQRMQDICQTLGKVEKPDIPGFMDKIYDCLKKIFGDTVFDLIFKDREYDIVFMAELCSYLTEQANPHMQSVIDRLSNVSKKYSKDNLNEPVDPQTTENG